MKVAFESLGLMKAMVEKGNPNSVTDGAVGALCVRTAIGGALLNVKINATSYKDKAFVNQLIAEGEKMYEEAQQIEKEILDSAAKLLV